MERKTPMTGAHLLLPHMLCVLSHFSCVPLCDPMDHGPPGSSVHGILQARIPEWVAISSSSDKVWSESMKLKVLVAHSCLAFCDPMDCNPSGSSVHGILRVRILGWVAIPFSRGSCQTRDWTQVAWGCVKVKVSQLCPTLSDPMDSTVYGILQARLLEWVSHSLLQGIFPTQGLNPGLPHCRRILYQLSHKGSLSICGETLNQVLHVKSADVSEGRFTVKAILPMVF